jgi:hypothetical protein
MEALFLDEALWSLSAPRVAIESYCAAVCNELGLDWQAYSHLQRAFKEALNAVAKVQWAFSNVSLTANSWTG